MAKIRVNDTYGILIRSLLTYERETGILRWVGTRSGVTGKDAVAGSIDRKGYVRVTVCGVEFMGHQLAWFFVHGEFPEMQLDHKDCNKANNAISNLREVTNGQNCCRRGPQRNNTTGVKGVSGKPGRYRVRVGEPGIGRKHLGYFETLEEAKKVADEARVKLHGEFCNNASS